MLEFAPRLPQRLLDEIERQSRRRGPIAEINRRVGVSAWRMGLPRPSYQQVRVLVHAARRLRGRAPMGVATAQLKFAYREVPFETVLSAILAPPAERLRDRAPPSK
ncbi:MAG TPA: hypothetical protein VHD91_00710 [Gaiellaceae bacterium]|nr:hypothetical protein [Gaiellaceae bacterium]